MKISVMAARYALSGVPLAQQKLARALSSAGHNVELIYGAVNKGFIIQTTKDFKTTVLNKTSVRKMFFSLIKHFKINKPEVVFSAGDHLNVVVLLAAIIAKSKAKISCSSRVTPYDTYSNIPFTKRWVLKYLMQLVMFRANVLTCVSHDMIDQYKRIFKSSSHVCIYNIVVDNYSYNQMHESIDEEWLINKTVPVIIATGMLEKWKGFNDLIHAFSKLLNNKKAKLLILGEGSLRSELDEQIKILKLENSVKLIGNVDNPLKYFSRADIFALSSIVEGLPNALVEAMMCGCTPVATNCPTGPREILNNGKYGYLVPVRDPAFLAKSLELAIDNPISNELLEEAVSPFTEKNVINKHFNSLGVQ